MKTELVTTLKRKATDIIAAVAKDRDPVLITQHGRRVFAHVELLSTQSELGPAIPELRPNSRYRQIVEPPCRIFYRHDKKAGKLYILGVTRGEKLFRAATGRPANEDLAQQKVMMRRYEKPVHHHH